MTVRPAPRARRLTVASATALALVLAACGGDDSPAGPLPVTGTDVLQFEPDQLQARAGTVTIELTAEDEVEHTLVIEELDDLEVVAAAAGETATGSAELAAGAYTFYCDVEGHRSAGMEGTLTVEE